MLVFNLIIPCNSLQGHHRFTLPGERVRVRGIKSNSFDTLQLAAGRFIKLKNLKKPIKRMERKRQ